MDSGRAPAAVVASAPWAKLKWRTAPAQEAVETERVRALVAPTADGEPMARGALVQAGRARRGKPVPAPTETHAAWNAAQTTARGPPVHQRPRRAAFESDLAQVDQQATTSSAARPVEALRDGSSACPAVLGPQRVKRTAVRLIDRSWRWRRSSVLPPRIDECPAAGL